MNPKKVYLFSFFILVSLFLLTPGFHSYSLQKDQPRTLSPIHIGSRLELFADDYLIDYLDGKAELRLHNPTPEEIVLLHNEPWEGNACGYHSIFQDGGKYKMYYKACQIVLKQGEEGRSFQHPLFCCYAESDDGINWYKPNLGLIEFNGSKNNNIVFTSGIVQGVDINGGHVTVFKDENPTVTSDALYKALIRANEQNGIFAFKSPDGFRWTLMNKIPIITDGKFDTQNIAFWDSEHGEYRAYWRYYNKEMRDVRTAVSKNFIDWNSQKDLVYSDSLREQLYTNQVKPYYRAPHIYIAFPTRYIDRGWSVSMRALPDKEHREWRSGFRERYGTALTEGLFMISRDGVHFKRWNEAFLRPGIEHPGTWNYGNQYIGWSVTETKSKLEGAPNELSLYAGENHWVSSVLRRYTLRMDGFVSIYASMDGGEIVTKSLTFTGKNLFLNFSSSAAGGIRVEIQDIYGRPLPGFSLEDCSPIFGDAVERVVYWKNGSDLSAIEGEKVRLRFVLNDADLFSFRFQ